MKQKILIFTIVVCFLASCQNKKVSHHYISTDQKEMFLNGDVRRMMTYDSIINGNKLFMDDGDYLFNCDYQIIKFNSKGNFDTIISGFTNTDNNVITSYIYSDNEDKDLRYKIRFLESTNDTIYQPSFTYVFHNDTIEYKSKTKTKQRILQYWKNNERILHFYESSKDVSPTKYQKTIFNIENGKAKFLSSDFSDKRDIKKFQAFWTYDDNNSLINKVERNFKIEKKTKDYFLEEFVYTGFHKNQAYSCLITRYEFTNNIFKQKGERTHETYQYKFDDQSNWIEKEVFEKGILIRKVKREISYK